MPDKPAKARPLSRHSSHGGKIDDAPLGPSPSLRPGLAAGGGLTRPAFVTALHAALRALLDTLGAQAFNVVGGMQHVVACGMWWVHAE